MILTNKILKYILATLLFLLSSIHIQKIIFKGIGLNQFTLIISVCFGIAILKESRILYSFSFYLFALSHILTAPDVSLSAVAPLFAALLYYNNPKMVIAILTGLPSFLVLNFFIYERLDFDNLALLIMGNLGFLLFLYMAIINKSSDIKMLAKTTPLNVRQLLILKYICCDIKRKDIPKIVKDSELWSLDIDRSGFTLDIINTEISKIKSKNVLNINNAEALGVWYITQTEILEREKQSIKKNITNYRTNISNPFNKKRD